MALGNNYYDPTDAAKKRGQSYFPAASQYAGAPAYIQQAAQRNLAAGNQGIARFNAIANPQQPVTGTAFDPRTGAGQYAAGYRAPQNENLVTYTLPSGGTIRLPAGSPQPANTVLGESAAANPLGQQDLSAAYQRGYGAPTPTVQGGYLAQGGVQTPISLLTPQQRSQYGASTFRDMAGTYLGQAGQALGALGTLSYNAFAGLRKAFGSPQLAQYGSQMTGAPNYGQNKPRRYSDYY